MLLTKLTNLIVSFLGGYYISPFMIELSSCAVLTSISRYIEDLTNKLIKYHGTIPINWYRHRMW